MEIVSGNWGCPASPTRPIRRTFVTFVGILKTLGFFLCILLWVRRNRENGDYAEVRVPESGERTEEERRTSGLEGWV